MGYHKIHMRVTTRTLARLFNRGERTIHRWINSGIVDPTSMESIIAKYLELKNKIE